MNNTQAVLAAMSRMQSNAQAALPVSPNNGNPGGAYNMPHGGQQAQPAAPSDPWPWLQPSPFMQTLQQDLMARSERLRQELESTNAQPVVPVMRPAAQQVPPVIPQIPLAHGSPQGLEAGLVLPVRNMQGF